MEDLQGKVAVVTGGASGIGSGICRVFAREGLSVVVADLDLERAGRLAGELSGQGAKAVPAQVDVSEYASVEALAERALGEFGAVDLVCNNAGVYIGGPMDDLTPDDWRWVMSVNLDGVFYGCRVFSRILLEQGRGGHIVNTASVGGFLSHGEGAAYAVSKYGVVALSESLREQLKPHGIGVSALAPGPVRTALSDSDERRPEALADAGNKSAVLWEFIKHGIEPVEVGELVLRGVRDNAAYIFTDPSFRKPFEERFIRILNDFDRLD